MLIQHKIYEQTCTCGTVLSTTTEYLWNMIVSVVKVSLSLVF